MCVYMCLRITCIEIEITDVETCSPTCDRRDDRERKIRRNVTISVFACRAQNDEQHIICAVEKKKKKTPENNKKAWNIQKKNVEE